MRRLFTFGCSYTSWNWPTWADILGLEYDVHENWGHAGLGNRAIAERVAECHVKNNFTKDDTIFVQWSSHLRYDWLKFNSVEPWQTKGSIFSYQNEKTFDKKWVDTFYDEKALFLHTLNNIILTKGLLDSIDCEYYFTSISDIKTLGTDIPHQKGHGENLRNTPELADAFTEYEVPEYRNVLQGREWLEPLGLHAWNRPNESWWFENDKGEKWIELHPSPSQHLSWVDSVLHNQILTAKQKKLIDTTMKSKTNDYKETISNITSAVQWNRNYRGF
jgi:hypothetical protein